MRIAAREAPLPLVEPELRPSGLFFGALRQCRVNSKDAADAGGPSCRHPLGTGRLRHPQARWQETPRFGVLGEDIVTVGNHGRCHGSIHAGLQNNPAKPGWVQLTLRSKGFSTDNCKALVKFVYHNTHPPFNHERFIPVTGGRQYNKILAQKRYFIGSGLDLVAMTPMDPSSKNVSYYIAIP